MRLSAVEVEEGGLRRSWLSKTEDCDDDDD